MKPGQGLRLNEQEECKKLTNDKKENKMNLDTARTAAMIILLVGLGILVASSCGKEHPGEPEPEPSPSWSEPAPECDCICKKPKKRKKHKLDINVGNVW